MADDFPNLTDIMPDIAGHQVRPRRHGHAMIRLRYPYNTSKGPLIALGQND